MLAGGIVEPGAGREPTVCAYVAFSAGRHSRVFRVNGPAGSIKVTELSAATTIDSRRFQLELEQDLEPAVQAARAVGGTVGITRPKDGWVTDHVKKHLEAEGIKVD